MAAPLTEQQVRQMIQQEMAKSNQAGVFSMSPISSHTHTGKGQDGPQINQNDILPGLRTEGSIKMIRQTTYLIGINFNPTAIWIHGNVVGASGEKFMVVGNAQLGQSFYLQPSNSNSVVTGGPLQKVIQSNTYFGGTSGAGGVLHTLVDEGHIINVSGYPTKNDIYVRATITGFDNKGIYISVDTLSSGWEINISWTVT